MKKIYVLNTTEHKLHIYGFCPNSKSHGLNYQTFETEEDARKFDGLALGWCKSCLKRREEVLQEYLKKEN